MTSIESIKKRIKNDAKTHGYFLTSDPELLDDLLQGLKKNEERYSYPSCPCRLASGELNLDRDIICPCDYRDPDIDEYQQCYCGLFVTEVVHLGKVEINPIPERRPQEKQARAYTISKEKDVINDKENSSITKIKSENNSKLWYCQQCGYVCFREDPPYVCPICKAKREMFAKLVVSTKFEN